MDDTHGLVPPDRVVPTPHLPHVRGHRSRALLLAAACVAVSLVTVNVAVPFLWKETPFTVSSEIRTLLVSSGAGATAVTGEGVPLQALTWSPLAARAMPACEPRSMHDITTALVSGEERLSLGVLVLSCGRSSCAGPRAKARALYNVSAWAARAPDGFSYCDDLGAQLSTVSWADLWAVAHPPVARFIVGAHDMTPLELAALQLEQAQFEDIMLLPSGDTYNDLFEKVLHGFVAFSETVTAPASGQVGRFTAIMKTDADSFVRLPQLLWGLQRLLPTAVDTLDGGRYTDVAWGHFLLAFDRPPLRHDFAGGGGYVLTAGLLHSIVAQMRSAPALHRRSTGGLSTHGLGSAEDLGVSLLVLSRPHMQVNPPARFHDIPGGVNKFLEQPLTPSSLVIHNLKSSKSWRAVEDRLRMVHPTQIDSASCSSSL